MKSKPTQKKVQWEYALWFDLSVMEIEKLHNEQGWELVTEDHGKFYFKRPIQKGEK